MQAIHGMAPGHHARRSSTSRRASRTPTSWRSTCHLGERPERPADHERVARRVRGEPAQPDAEQRRALSDQRQREPAARRRSARALSNSSEPAQAMLLQQAVMEGRTFFASSGDAGSSCAALYPGRNGVCNEGVPLTEDPADSAVRRRRRRHRALLRQRRARANRFLEYAWTYSGGNASPFITAPDYQQGVPNLDRTCVSDAGRRARATPGQLCRGVPDVAAISGDVVSNGYTIVSDGAGVERRRHEPVLAAVGRHVGARRRHGAGRARAGTASRTRPSTRSRRTRAHVRAQLLRRHASARTASTRAQPGYDYVTGFGTPRLKSLIADVKTVAPAVTAAGSGTSAGGPRFGERRARARRSAPTRGRLSTRYKGKRKVTAGGSCSTAPPRTRAAARTARGSVKSVKVSIARTGRHRLHVHERQGPADEAALLPEADPARGAGPRGLGLRAEGPPAGRELPIVARGYDTAGNKERPRKHKNTLKLRIR